jgi:hypothetical protein
MLLRVAAFLVTVAVSVALWFASSGGTTMSATPEGVTVVGKPLWLPFGADGRTQVALGLAYPVALSLVALVVSKLRMHAAIGMALFSVVGSMSIGLFYIPSTVLLFWCGPSRQAAPRNAPPASTTIN